MNKDNEFITELLDYIDPAVISYQEWVNIGMALKEEGFALSVWESFSRRDEKRYHTGECESKWRGFNGSVSPVTGGTIYEIARSYGFTQSAGSCLDWDGVIGDRSDSLVVVDRNRIENREIAEPEVWDPKEQLIQYLTLFDPSENVGYVTETWERDGKYLPTQGCYDRTAGRLIQDLKKCTDIREVIGDYNESAGAWIRFNPLDGKGVKNENVTEYRYALVESDSTELGKQNAILRELELPIAMLVYSGGKSLHAIVRIDAVNYMEYRNRVDFLYNICRKNGLGVDSQNRNPSRLSRMPGIVRNSKKQFIVDTNIGKRSWDEWREWIESTSDELPDPESFCDVWDNVPELSPCLIDGVLRQGHKMMVTGPSKAGKSFALIELTIAIAEGTEWLGWRCTRGKVMYINLELDRASCLHRFKDVYKVKGLSPNNISNIDIWNLRGMCVPLDKLVPKLIRRARKKNYIAIIIDPIYKVITGDENSAEQMAYFCNQFDKIAKELETAVIYCHHHSKGNQGGKISMDRASGSGVFARDPDALLDLTELSLSNAIKQAEINKFVEQAAVEWLTEHCVDWEDRILRDDLCSESKALDACRSVLMPQSYVDMMRMINDGKLKLNRRTAWRVEGTLREFPSFKPKNLWFEYPLHKTDTDGVLEDIKVDAAKAPWEKAMSVRKPVEEKKRKRDTKLEMAFASLELEGVPITVDALAEAMGVSDRTVWRYIKDNGGFIVEKNDGKSSTVMRQKQ